MDKRLRMHCVEAWPTKLIIVLVFLVWLFSILGVVLYNCPKYEKKNETLKFVHVLFRHGQRTTDSFAIYPKDPYKRVNYHPYGYGHLTNKGKRTMYKLGKRLRERYRNVLTDLYDVDSLEAVCSDRDRSQESLQVVLVGLYPPIGTKMEWHRTLNWQPVVFKQLPYDTHMLSFPYTHCAYYAKLMQEHLRSKEGRDAVEKVEELYTYLTENTGVNVTTPFHAWSLYAAINVEKEWGLEVPAWARSVYPEIMRDASFDFFYSSTATTKLKQLSGGFLLKKIVHDTRSLLAKQPKENGGRKMFLYSGHEYNIAYLQIILGLYAPHFPEYGACMFLEVHTINDTDGVMIYYQTDVAAEPVLLKMPACDYFCPWKKFVALVREYLPSNGMCNKII